MLSWCLIPSKSDAKLASRSSSNRPWSGTRFLDCRIISIPEGTSSFFSGSHSTGTMDFWWLSAKMSSSLQALDSKKAGESKGITPAPVSYTHLRAHETPEHLVCRLLLEKKKKRGRRK
eukprot:TRINITY_DN22478_c0_g1_i1.p1 TRINITY_DN22478_c0_g1~~TRINITY_DN22478_c0_g1_i1.p1  ORF type:complete len:118 (-),score=17.54 TRINITY_DN22478_c0_g1_i1:104-457(-)